MTATPPVLGPELAELIRACRDRFRQDWADDRAPRLQAALESLPESARAAAFAQLLEIDLQERSARGETIWADDYLERFPDFDGEIALALAQMPAEICSSAGTVISDPLPVPPAVKKKPSVGAWLGDYELVQRLGGGAMGQVFRAQHRFLRKTVAVKILAPSLAENPKAMARFRREMQMVGQMNHPNLVQATDAGCFEQVHYLVMEYIDGVDLHKLLVKNGPLPLEAAAELIRQAALALDSAHRQGLVHRDIKPGNIILGRDLQLKVVDFGLARLIQPDDDSEADGLSVAGQLLGTPDYIAPEQAGGLADVDHRADIYSLGCTFYALLAGTGPFQDSDHMGMARKIHAHLRGTFPSIRDRRADVPFALAKLIGQMTAREPEDRIGSLAQVAEQLTTWLGNRSGVSVSTQFETLLAQASTGGPAGPVTPLTPVSSARSKASGSRSVLPRSVSMRLGLAAALLGAVAVVGWSLWPLAARGDSEAATAQPLPVTISTFEVVHFIEGEQGFRQRQGAIGVESLAAYEGESVQITGHLPQPAYAYLIALNPDGTVQLCLPGSEDEIPRRMEGHLVYPGLNSVWTLTDGAGQQAFVLLASSRPLPSFRRWQEEAGRLPWRATSLDASVWRFDGEQLREGLLRGTIEHLELGHALPDVCAWLQRQDDIEAVRVIAFPVYPVSE
jgi:serine/threonine protein kinase